MKLPIAGYVIPLDREIKIEAVTDTSEGRTFWYRAEPNGPLIGIPAEYVSLEEVAE
jgi:hypothetical protein